MKQTRTNFAVEQKVDDIGGFIYENNQLKYLLTEEGRALTQSGGTFECQYFLKDHLGNTRITFNQNGQIIQEDAYYPFGMQMNGLCYQSGVDYENKYLYNGKELQDDFGLDWYDYGARMYDAVIGRWHVVDPLTEKYPGISTNAYCANNPILFLDNDGQEPISAIIDAITAFTVEAGMSYVENIVLNEMDALTAFDNIRWGDACIEAAKSYGLSLLITGIGSTKAFAKAANSKIGKVTLEFTANVVGEFIKSYKKGEFYDENGSFDMDKFLNSDFQGLMQGAIIEALVAQGFSKKAQELTAKLNKVQANLAKHESKLNKSLNKGASVETIANRTAKVDEAQKEVVKTMGNTGAASTSKEVVGKGTNKANEQRRKK